MKKWYRAQALVFMVILSLAVGLFVNRFVIAQPSQTLRASQETEVQKWEYCAITGIAYFSNEGKPYYQVNIIYSNDPKNRVEVKIPFPEDPLLSMISRLGADRWEMVGLGALNFTGYNSNHLYFKRPAK